MQKAILTRMGDGERLKMSPSEIKTELQDGSQTAASMARIPDLTDNEIEQLCDIIAEPGRIVSVPHGQELIVTDDGIAECFGGSEADGGSGVSISRQSSVLSYERGRRMKLADAKQYVAEKLKVDVMDLVDEDVMYGLRKDLGIGVVTPEAGGPEGILAKCKVAELLDIEINSVQRFKSLIRS